MNSPVNYFVTDKTFTEWVAKRPAGTMQRIAPAIRGRVRRKHDGAPGLVIDTEHPAYAELRAEFRPDLGTAPAVNGRAVVRVESIPPPPMPRNEWPKLISAVAWFRGAKDRGVGDTIQTAAKMIGLEVVALALEYAAIHCGCARRKRWLNARFPYGSQ